MRELIKATKVSKQLFELLSPGPFKVHSRFKNGINLNVSHMLSFIGIGGTNIPPLGIVLEHGLDNGFMGLKYDYFYWDNKSKTFESSEVVIDLNNAKIIDNSLIFEKNSISLSNLSIVTEIVDKNLRTGLGETVGNLSSLKLEFIKDLCTKFKSTDPLDIQKTLKLWVGRGIGLTPSGDDFLQGIIFINEIYPILGEMFIDELRKIIDAGGYTTEISINYYKLAFLKMYSSTLIGLYHAIKVGNSEEINRYVNELMEFGNTSGVDILSGILTGINFAKICEGKT